MKYSEAVSAIYSHDTDSVVSVDYRHGGDLCILGDQPNCASCYIGLAADSASKYDRVLIYKDRIFIC